MSCEVTNRQLIDDSAFPNPHSLNGGLELSAQPVVTSTLNDSVARFGRDLTPEQRRILQVVADGKSVFFTGVAGLLPYYMHHL